MSVCTQKILTKTTVISPAKHFLFPINMCESGVGIVPKLWDVQFRVWILVGTRDFSLSPKWPNWFWGPNAVSYSMDMGVLDQWWSGRWEVKRLMHEVHCLHLVQRSRTSGVVFLLSLYVHTMYRGSCTTTYVWLNFFKWILSKHSALANRIISILTRLCTGKPSNLGLISDQNIQPSSGANPATYSVAKALVWPSATTYCWS